MLRTTNCGALTLAQLGEEVTLAGWVQKSRDKGFMLWVDLRDRYGITQIIFDEEPPKGIEFKAGKIYVNTKDPMLYQDLH